MEKPPSSQPRWVSRANSPSWSHLNRSWQLQVPSSPGVILTGIHSCQQKEQPLEQQLQLGKVSALSRFASVMLGVCE